MPLIEKIIPNLYRDSVALMQLSARISGLSGIARAVAIMATRANLALLAEAGWSSGNLPAHPNDMLVVVEGDEAAIAAAMVEIETELHSLHAPAAAAAGAVRPASIAMAIEDFPQANMALIATPGEYAAAEAMKALRLGLNVMLFSSGVALEDEIRLKLFAHDHGLIVMGPDCGTAIVNGIPLGFANVLRRGPIGVVAAAGTGLQEVACLIDRSGSGISQAIGTGGRDLGEAVGGIAMLQGLAALAADANTRIIVLISKPPSAKAATAVCAAAARSGKPVVISFLGARPAAAENLHPAATLEDAARIAVALERGEAVRPARRRDRAAAAQEAARLDPGQKYVRGLYSGGTLCYEALLLLQRDLGPVRSNTPLDPAYALPDVWASCGHTAVDLGDEVFTRGRPHPMVDQRLRNERIAREVEDPETAVILFDVVLGHGAHPDPAPGLAAAVGQARRRVKSHVAFVASICGTAGDPQDLHAQERTLRAAGVLVAPSNAAAARLAAGIALAKRESGEAS